MPVSQGFVSSTQLPAPPPVDVYMVPAGVGLAGAAPVLSNVPFGVVSDYLVVPAGAYDVFVTLAGTNTGAIEARSLSVLEQLVVTVAALDAPGGGVPFTLEVLSER